MAERKRVEVHMQDGFYEALRVRADAEGIGMGEWLLRAGCKELGLPVESAVMPRQKTGRKAGQKARPRRKAE